MKLHNTLVETLIKTYEVNSGWTEEKKLRTVLSGMDFSVYTQQDGTQVLVATKALQEAIKDIERAQSGRK